MVNSQVSSNSDARSVNKSVFEISKMDCSAEEQMVRMALDSVEAELDLS